MPDHLDSVKAFARNIRASAVRNVEDNPDMAKRQMVNADAIDALVTEVAQARERLRPLSTEYGDISDLPPEVVAELNLTKIDELEQQLRDIVAAGDGAEVGLDPIIIELWRRHKVSHPRRFVMNKLYRMGAKGLIESVEGRKGVYMVPKRWTGRPSAFDSDLDDDVPF
jgi:hypothetical protein